MATQQTADERHRTTERVAQAAHDTVDRAAERGARAEEYVRDNTDRYRQQTEDFADQVSGYVREHPYRSLGMAVAAGFIIGSLLRR
ncbi:DUF883 family protein [Ectothiorhodospiraceae bacterium WFHF3C12]|nr:DUF883 family protein [Ectothiorhodospiraceae bacterium WFHF3C12]